MVLGRLFKGLANTSEDTTGVERTVRRVGQGRGDQSERHDAGHEVFWQS